MVLEDPSTNTGSTRAPDASTGRLATGSLSEWDIVFIIMAAIAPAAGAIGMLPLAIGLGAQVGTPGVFLITGFALLCFAVGFVRMVPLVRNAGAFYAFIRQGLGRMAGLIAAFIALTAYVAIGTSLLGAFAFFANLTFASYGLDIRWEIWAVLCVILVFAMSYFRVKVAAKVLTVLFLLEALAVLVIDLAILFKEGVGSFGAIHVFAPSQVFHGGVFGVGVMYAFSFFQGFEGTAIYAEEAKAPERTIPRATYLAIGCITAWYVFTSWAFVVAGGGYKVGEVTLADPGLFVFNLSDKYVAAAWTSMLNVLIVTSMFAGVLAFHNAAIRYMFSLSRDGFLPQALGKVHAEYRTPTVAGVVNAVLLLAISLGFAMAKLDPLLVLSTSMTGFGAVGVLGLVTATSLAVAVYFWHEGQRDLTHFYLPVLGAVGVGYGLYLSLTNYEFITGTSNKVINALPWIHLVTIVIVVLVGSYVRRSQPARWEQAGGDHSHEAAFAG